MLVPTVQAEFDVWPSGACTTDGLIEFSHDAEEGEVRLLAASRDALRTKSQTPARFIVEHVLQGEAQYPDDVAVLTISFE